MKKTNRITTTSQGLATELKKRSLVYTFLYTLLLCVVSGFLIFNYFAVFTSNFYPTNFKGSYYLGVVETNNFNNCKKGQLITFEQYEDAYQIAVGDEIYFKGNAGEGSGVVKKLYLSQNYIKILTNNVEHNVSISTILGKIVQKTDNWGYVVWFLQSWYGIIALNIVIIVLVLLRIVFCYTVETSPKGKELQFRMRAQKKSNIKYKKMHKNYINTELDADSLELLDGEFDENKKKVLEYSKRKDISNAYKFLLQKVHSVYIGKNKLTALDRKKIANCVELMCLVEQFDIDSEYMLTDLILKTPAIHFDLERFLQSCNNYLIGKHYVEDLECFASVLYVLLKKNKHLRKKQFINFCDKLENYLSTANWVQDSAHLLKLCGYIKKLI